MIGILAALLLLAMGAGPPSPADKRKQTAEEKKTEDLTKLSSRLRKLNGGPHTSEQRFLHERASKLLERAGQAPAGSYLFDRLESAIDDLLDASELIAESATNRTDRDEDAREKTARDLERTYFRLAQGDYFAGQSREPSPQEYIQVARRLYQMARNAYDTTEYWRARRLAEAAREVIGGLEDLAQSVVRIPEPLKE